MANTHHNLLVRERFGLFVDRAEQLDRTTLVRNRFASQLKVHFEQRLPPVISTVEPNEDSLRSFLLLFRQFLLADDPVFISAIFNLAERHLTSDELRDGIREARQAWRQTLSTGELRLVVNRAELTPETLLDLWINGFYFHNDLEKAARLRTLFAPVGAIARTVFLSAAIDLTGLVLYTGNTLRIALNEGLISETARARA
jgi:hypothetical protein